MEIPTPVAAAPIETSRRGRRPSDEPNPFLDNGWLWDQYEEVNRLKENGGDPATATRSVVVPGEWETRQATNRQKELLFDAETGEPIMTDVLIGDAANVVRLLRKAADLHEIGVSIQTAPATGARGKELKGQVEVKFLAKDRSVKRRKGQDDE